MADVTIYWLSGSPYSWRTTLTCVVKGIAWEGKRLAASKESLKSPDYLCLNPRGKVPTVVHGDHVVYESLATMTYLEAAFPDRPIFGRTPIETGTIWRRLSELTLYLGEHALTKVVRPIYFGEAATPEGAERVRAAMVGVHRELALLEASLQHAPFAAGDAISAADIAVFPFLASLDRAAQKPVAADAGVNLLPWTASVRRSSLAYPDPS